MNMREYRTTDLDRVIQLFEETVSRINIQDYSSEQLSAWIGHPDKTNWQVSLLAHQTYVMFEDEVLAGFADMTASGYLDRLYVGADYQGRGIASALVAALEEAIPVKRYATEASIIARPFFESRGYQTIKQNVVIRDGIELTNFTMVKKAIK